MAAATSSIPTACTQTESTVLSAPIAKVWAVFREFKLETIAPDFVASTEGSAQVGSMVKVRLRRVQNDPCRDECSSHQLRSRPRRLRTRMDPFGIAKSRK